MLPVTNAAVGDICVACRWPGSPAPADAGALVSRARGLRVVGKPDLLGPIMATFLLTPCPRPEWSVTCQDW